LKKRENFDLSKAYKALGSKDGVVTSVSIADFLEERHYYATEKELSFIMSRLDKDGDDVVSYMEFV